MSTHKRSIAAALVAFMLPAQLAFSCPSCVASWTNLFFPFSTEAVALLAVWRLVYGYQQLKSGQRTPNAPIAGPIAKRVIYTLVAGLILGMGGLLLYFVLSFSKATYRLVTDGLNSTRTKTFRRLAMIHAVTAVILIPLIVGNYVRWSNMDAIAKAKKYVYRGTIPERYLLEKYVADPRFDLARMKELLQSPDARDRELAFKVLQKRNSFNDLVFLREVVLEHPDLPSALLPSARSKAFFFQNWLRGLGVKNDVTTKEELRAWIDRTSGDAVENQVH